MKLERIAKYTAAENVQNSHSIEQLMGLLQSQIKHFMFSSLYILGLKQYQQHLVYDH